MKITIRPELVERLEAIDWFVLCGQPLQLSLSMKYQPIESWERAIQCYHDPDWEDTTLEARNVLTQYLSARCRAEFQQWNRVTEAAGDFFEARITPKLRAFQATYELDEKFIHSVEWNLVAALMQDAYHHCAPRENFFPELLCIYEAGHFPCGWDGGEWPIGRLIVF